MGEDVNLEQVTPLVLTYNEVANIGRTLSALAWAKRIVVVDSGSDDGTLEVIKRYPQAVVFHRQFDTHAKQWNFGLTKIASAFTLSLDADYLLTAEFVRELQALSDEGVDGWFAPFKYCVGGKPLRASLLPSRLVLFRTSGAHYSDDGHTQRLDTPPVTRTLRTPILHDDRKAPSRWRDSQAKYADLEVTKLLASSSKNLDWPDRLRLFYLGPVLVLPYCLFAKGLVLAGASGWSYSVQRWYAEWVLAMRLFRRRHWRSAG